MTEDRFWQLIDTRLKAGGDIVRHADVLVAELSRMPIEEILSYESHYVRLSFEAYDRKLWAAASILEDLGDDDFLDFRDWLISQGKAAYFQVLNEPENLINLAEPGERVTAEEMGSVARRAYLARTGSDDFPALFTPPPHPAIKNASLVWLKPEGCSDEQRLRVLFPKLWEKFRGPG
jgi:hypothetical protein